MEGERTEAHHVAAPLNGNDDTRFPAPHATAQTHRDDSTVSVQLSLLPDYITGTSQLVHSLAETDCANSDSQETGSGSDSASQPGTPSNVAIPIPVRFIPPPTIEINSIDSLNATLQLLDFWCVDELPKSVCDFVVRQTSKVTQHTPSRLATTLTTALRCLEGDTDGMLVRASQAGLVWLLKYAVDSGLGNWSAEVCRVAASSCNLPCLMFAHEHGCPWDSDTCAAAATSGASECLRFAKEHGCPWNSDTVKNAAMAGNAECLHFALSEGCPQPDEINMLYADLTGVQFVLVSVSAVNESSTLPFV